MVKLRWILGFGISVLVLGSCGAGMARCNNLTNYGATKGKLALKNPSCAVARKELKKFKKDDSPDIWKYLRGDSGTIDAYNEYINKKCKK